ncbi:alpha/beta fold hydrolase [Paenibacillus sanguinis]|uniref:alpha/beta fold hydrolase n=1 Tax=Paenibacillus sanguinis TaxID=225906 RepID=UPI00035FC21B|nr:alpha/beta hydrolase [Paenibacillus sanguinis]
MSNRSRTGLMELQGEARTGDVALYYEYTAPDRPCDSTLVFIHAHAVNHRMWEPQVKEFAADYPVLRYDLRGYGYSSLPREGEDYLHAEDLRQLLERLSIGKVHLIGLSLGAFVALDYWALYPQQVGSVTVASAGIPDPRPEAVTPFTGDIADFKQAWYNSLLAHCGPDRNGYSQRLWAMIADWTAWQPTHAEPECLLRERLLPMLKQCGPVPVCAIAGERDSEGAKASLRLLLEHVPQGELVSMADVGHFCSMESPERFNSLLRSFWSRHAVLEG